MIANIHMMSVNAHSTRTHFTFTRPTEGRAAYIGTPKQSAWHMIEYSVLRLISNPNLTGQGIIHGSGTTNFLAGQNRNHVQPAILTQLNAPL